MRRKKIQGLPPDLPPFISPPLTRAVEILALLDNPEFIRHVHDYNEAMARSREPYRSDEERLKAWPKIMAPWFNGFMWRWRVFPPPLFDPIYADAGKQAKGDAYKAMQSGRWGVVPVFPWTTQAEIRDRSRRIGKAIGKQHRDADKHYRSRIAYWLKLHRVPYREIARVVWKRQYGLRRPTREEAITKLPEKREMELLSHYKSLGFSYKQASDRVYRRAQGSEAPASAAVRMAVRRYLQDSKRIGAGLPARDPIAYPLTMLLQTLLTSEPNTAEAVRWAKALQDALVQMPSA